MRLLIDGKLCSFVEEGNYATLAYPRELALSNGKLIRIEDVSWEVIKIEPSNILKSVMLAKLKYGIDNIPPLPYNVAEEIK